MARWPLIVTRYPAFRNYRTFHSLDTKRSIDCNSTCIDQILSRDLLNSSRLQNRITFARYIPKYFNSLNTCICCKLKKFCCHIKQSRSGFFLNNFHPDFLFTFLLLVLNSYYLQIGYFCQIVPNNT